MGVSTFFPSEVMKQAHQELVATLPPSPEDHFEIVVIKRSGRRELREHDDLILALSAKFPQHSVRVFTADGHVRDHALVFHAAAAVVAPHGAGLRNIM
jgi:hypothetical protein